MITINTNGNDFNNNYDNNGGDDNDNDRKGLSQFLVEVNLIL